MIMAVHQLPQKPTLLISESAVTFPTTSPGMPKFAVLTITQQQSNEPIILSSDSPEYFQLASDKYPKYSSSVTLQPLPMGTYVHVRYVADKSGTHYGQLSIQSTYDQKTVALEGRSTRFLPVLASQPAYGRPAYGLPERPDLASIRKKMLLALGSVAVLGLIWLGYANRTALFSEDVPDEVSSPSIAQPLALPTAVTDKPISTKLPAPTAAATRRQASRESNPAEDEQTNERPTPNRLGSSLTTAASPQAEQTVDNQPERTAKPASEAVNKRPNQRINPKVIEEESELEKELNQPLTSQP